MKETLLTCLKYFLYAVAVALSVLVVCGVVLLMNWPWWIGIVVVLVLLGLAAGALMLVKLRARHREQQFVQQVIEQDNAQLKNLSLKEQSQLKELQQSWKQAVETLRKSHLRKHGNPLYVLPWYLVMGESGSGKSTAIGSAKLSSPFAEVLHSSGLSGTRNCDWWFFDEAVLIDTAGRYAMPVDSGRDNEEWQKFLSLLVKYRRREPIHGLIITVAADKLMRSSPEELEGDGKQLRRRMDELMRVLGIKFPVYTLVTKCDLVRGMTQFTDRLPEPSLDQPMGVCNEALSPDLPGFLGRVAASLAGRLKSLRLLMLHLPGGGGVPPELLLFPDEIGALQPGLDCFMRAAFQENRYQETPLLRGIYFSSGRQEGTPFSHFLGDLGMIAPEKVLPGTSRGLFLHDFFARILPGDRGLFAPTNRTLEWKNITKNLGLTSWVLLGVALSGLLSYSFVKNLATIRDAQAVVARSPEVRGDLMTDLATMDGFRCLIVGVEEKNRNWWFPRLGLNESKQVEVALKAKYCRQFQERFLVSFDKEMAGTISGFSPATPDEVAGRYLVHLARRINLLKARLDGAGLESLRSHPLPSYMASPQSPGDDPETTRKFGNLYLNYLAWRADSVDLGREMQLLQGWLRQLFLVKGGNLAWTVEFANREDPAQGLTIASFWGGSRALPDEPVIPPAFTRTGRVRVEALLAELSNAYPEPGGLEREKLSMEQWYRRSCYASWGRFAAWFPKGEERLLGAKEWQGAAALMATDQGPYFAFLKKVVRELEPWGPGEGVPPWVAQVFRFQALKAAAPAAGAAAVSQEAKNLGERLGKLVGQPPSGVESAESRLAGAASVQEYLGAVGQIAPVAKSRNLAHQMALQLFSEDPVVSKSPFYLAADAVQRVAGVVSGGRGDETFTRLISSPVTFYGSFVRMETACSLQRQWEEQVLREVQGASDPATLAYLLGKEGPVWKYVSATADPFLGWTPGRGYYSKSALGGSIPFEPGFFSFLTKGAKAKVAAAAVAVAPPVAKSYNVTIRGLPTDANGESRVKPQSTRLELQCAGSVQVIDNMNYPVSKTFAWSPEGCSDVVFQIDVGDAVLTKRYPGPQGFPEFLQDFPGGRHTFYPKEFPRELGMLERMGVRYLRVNYQFQGGHEVQAARKGGAQSQPGQIPARITPCWD